MFPVKLYCKGVVNKFFDKFLLTKYKIRSLIIVSPWITFTDFNIGSIKNVIEKVNDKKIPTYVITRKPSINSHIKIIEEFQSAKYTEINYSENLHAKIFICDCDEEPFALIGSANLTNNSHNNFEIGVMILGSGEGLNIIDQLINISKLDLRTSKQNIKIKKIGE